ncbi:C2 domain-containing protein, partial [Catenaria anguillulae PL171]
VTVLEARDLRNKELLFGKNDPYVELQLGASKVETKVHKDGGSAGVWNETHVLEFPEGIVALDVNVYDEDRLKLDDLIGRVEILLHETVEKGMTEGWFDLQNRRANKQAGRIHLKL